MEERYLESVLSEFFTQDYREDLLKLEETDQPFVVLDFLTLSRSYPDVAEELLRSPDRIIKAAEFIVSSELKSRNKKNVRVRFKNLPSSSEIKISSIRKKDLNRFVCIEGIVRKKSEVRPFLDSTRYECRNCNNIFPHKNDDEGSKPFCPVCKKANMLFEIDKSLIDLQKIVVEEMSDFLEGSDQPKRIDVFLKEDLTSTDQERRTNPGSRIRIIGVIKEKPEVYNGKKTGRYYISVECNFLESIDPTIYDIVISQEEKEEFIEIAKDPKVYQKLIASLAPSTYGYNRVKEALLYQILGGCRKEKESGVAIRGDMHVLLVGDPGAGKSQMLKRVSNIVPRARYVAGKGSSGAGLTASVVKDESFGGWTLEAGALVLANEGLVCIDEMDKMSTEDRSSMHEAMEQQTISISKATIQATLLSRTSVLAAANPKLGRFDPSDVISRQIDLPPSLINRFDLIFTILDFPDRERDENIASHILKMHTIDKSDDPNLIETEKLKKYLSYAKQHVIPAMTEEATEEIKKYYLNMRMSSNVSIPISPRQLEALIRMSEASAKARLSREVTKEDANRAIDLLKYCLLSVGYDEETGSIDIDRIGGVPASKRNKIKVIKKVFTDLESELGSTIPVDDVIKKCVDEGLKEHEVEDIIETMKREGEFFSPKSGFVKRVG